MGLGAPMFTPRPLGHLSRQYIVICHNLNVLNIFYFFIKLKSTRINQITRSFEYLHDTITSDFWIEWHIKLHRRMNLEYGPSFL